MLSTLVHGRNGDGSLTPPSFAAAGIAYAGSAISADVAAAVAPAAGLRLMGYAAAESAGAPAAAAFQIRHNVTTDPVTNGGFDTDSGWTKGAGWTIDAANANKAECDGSQAAASLLSQAIAALVPGVSYLLTFTTTRSAGSVTAAVGGTAGTARSTADTFAETIVCGADGTLAFTADADFIGSVDTVSLVPVADLVVPVALAASGSAFAWFGDDGIAVPNGLSIADVTGEYDVTLFTKIAP